ncbi:hypothetical protein CPHO_11025 [Corynebacterium phocae]|uniref:Uncharacterized protein n=1 Tax=Corynebacterium phocae TaxID=161895 RepID=A0A1L7D5E5_9CORY|nr:hypothetical protein [Corynebacterium phocae]APT93335.1 hypothetical protein CPHO_11025 [Corynebacterium phocae]KAA8721667.1 hypothetical protein F4V58_10500 [Corynebacterium phocae]
MKIAQITALLLLAIGLLLLIFMGNSGNPFPLTGAVPYALGLLLTAGLGILVSRKGKPLTRLIPGVSPKALAFVVTLCGIGAIVTLVLDVTLLDNDRWADVVFYSLFAVMMVSHLEIIVASRREEPAASR